MGDIIFVLSFVGFFGNVCVICVILKRLDNWDSEWDGNFFYMC